MKFRSRARLTALFLVVLVGVSLGVMAGASPSLSPLFTFGLTADVQYRDAETSGTRFYRESTAKLVEAVDRFNALRPAFVVQLGDLVDGA
jgi:alkaline phosphatase